MKAKALLGALCLLVLGGLVASLALARQAEGSAPVSTDIEGTYMLTHRLLPDGTKQMSPDIVGLITWTKKYRNLNVTWKDDKGKRISLSSIREYTLTDKEYTEKNIYQLENNEIGGKGITYDLSGNKGSSPVSQEGCKLKFQLPLFGEPVLEFDGDKFTATRDGEFVDHWEKVE